MDQCELCVAGSSLYMGWVQAKSSRVINEPFRVISTTSAVTAIYENSFMLSATSSLIGRPGVIVLHFL